jgi:hypothetical protein
MATQQATPPAPAAHARRAATSAWRARALAAAVGGGARLGGRRGAATAPAAAPAPASMRQHGIDRAPAMRFHARPPGSSARSRPTGNCRWPRWRPRCRAAGRTSARYRRSAARSWPPCPARSRIAAATAPRSTAERRPDHIVDARRAGGQHHQPVKAQRDAAGRGHMGQGCQKILVQRIAFAVDAVPFRPSRPRTGGAVRRGRSVRQSRWPVPPRRHKARTVRPAAGRPARARQCRLGRGIAVKDRGPAPWPRCGSTRSDQHGGQHVGPGVVRGCGACLRGQLARQRGRSVLPSGAIVAMQVDPRMPGKGLGHRQPLRARRRDRRSRSRKRRTVAPAAPPAASSIAAQSSISTV